VTTSLAIGGAEQSSHHRPRGVSFHDSALTFPLPGLPEAMPYSETSPWFAEYLNRSTGDREIRGVLPTVPSPQSAVRGKVRMGGAGGGESMPPICVNLAWTD
jgi:hypothetical protein